VSFLHGEEDPISPLQDIRAIAHTMPNGALQSFEGAGHLLLIQQFDALMRSIANLETPREMPRQTAV
jgi:pimeloyl-ACP methyl ester carboxylesterase